MRDKPLEWRIHWILRVAVALEFIGHGAFGIMTKEAWLPYYDLFGIPSSTAYQLMPLTGSVDIALGLLVLLRPTRAALLYMAFWGLYTATLRPLTGEGGWELVERAYNFGGPLALLLLHGWGTTRAQWLERIRAVPRLSRERAQALVLGFRGMIAAYLIGHGALGLLTDKQGLIGLYDSIGLTGLVDDPRVLNELIGSFEIALGLAVLAVPATTLLVFVCAWKLATEFLFVTAGAYGAGFEVIERACAYAAPIALIWLRGVLAREESARLFRRQGRLRANASLATVPPREKIVVRSRMVTQRSTLRRRRGKAGLGTDRLIPASDLGCPRITRQDDDSPPASTDAAQRAGALSAFDPLERR